MKFLDHAKHIISDYAQSRDTIPKVIQKITPFAQSGQIAFYPCGRYTNMLINELKRQSPELFPAIKGCFDKSSEAKTESGVPVYDISKLRKFKKEISLLVVASNTFYIRELRDIEKFAVYDGNMMKTSYFDISLSEEFNGKTILALIQEVYDALEDQKSKTTYLVTWLSRALNDESLTYLFEGENENPAGGADVVYRNYKLKGLDKNCAKELRAEIYKMRHVYPCRGDVVLDIGAYKGDSAIFFAGHIGGKGKIYAFEPTKSNYADLKNNVARNKLNDIIIPLNKGCAGKSGRLRAVSVKSGAPWAFLSDSEGSESVEVVSVDDFIAENGIDKLDFIKMDVEGMERDVIMGAMKTINRFKPRLAIPLYHNTSDLITIPLLISRLKDYRLYIRCKLEGPFGVTLYCAPKSTSVNLSAI